MHILAVLSRYLHSYYRFWRVELCSDCWTLSGEGWLKCAANTTQHENFTALLRIKSDCLKLRVWRWGAEMFEKVRRSAYDLKEFRRRSALNGEKKIRRGSVPGETSLPCFTASHASVYCGFTQSVVCHVLQYGNIMSVCIVHEDDSEIIWLNASFLFLFLL